MEETRSFENNTWKIADTAIFHHTPVSTAVPNDLLIRITHSPDYLYGNVYLFTDIVFPDGSTIRDTVQCILIDNNYEWIGTGTASKTATFPFRLSATFPQEGQYTFKFTQAMRAQDSTLHGIESITLLIK